MKQNITNEQFLSLSFKESLRLMELMGYPQKDVSEEFYNNNKELISERFSYIIKNINIGKMLEILEDKEKNIIAFRKVNQSMYSVHSRINGMAYDGWVVEITKDNSKNIISFKNNILCDALWDAIVNEIK